MATDGGDSAKRRRIGKHRWYGIPDALGQMLARDPQLFWREGEGVGNV